MVREYLLEEKTWAGTWVNEGLAKQGLEKQWHRKKKSKSSIRQSEEIEGVVKWDGKEGEVWDEIIEDIGSNCVEHYLPS